jgi:hypothetical protein
MAKNLESLRREFYILRNKIATGKIGRIEGNAKLHALQAEIFELEDKELKELLDA